VTSENVLTCLEFGDVEKGMASFWVFHQLHIVVTKPEHVKQVLKHDFFRFIMKKYYIFVCFAWKSLSHIDDGDLQILLATTERRPDNNQHFLKFLGRKSLIVLNGNEWKLHRTLVAHAFTTNQLFRMAPQISSVGDELCETFIQMMKNQQDREHPTKMSIAVDIEPWMKRATLDIIGRVAFGPSSLLFSRSLHCNVISRKIIELRCD
jgi:cytochrome P450